MIEYQISKFFLRRDIKMTILKELIGILRGEFKKLPDARGKKHRTYAIEDMAMSAYAMFYF